MSGLVVPVRVAGHPALDLCNTFAGWADGLGGDFLTSYDHLAVWAGEVGLVATSDVGDLRQLAAQKPSLARRSLLRTTALRTALYAVVTGQAAAGTGLTTVEGDAREAVAGSRLELHEGWRAGPGLEQPFHACALAAAHLVSEVPLDEIKACPGDGCGWVFQDLRGRRRWCRMEWCGNRAKQRLHAQRTQRDLA